MPSAGTAGTTIVHTSALLLAALVWGMAFPFQRIGSGYVGGWTFLAARAWLSVLVMLPVVIWKKHRAGQHYHRNTSAPSTPSAPINNSDSGEPADINKGCTKETLSDPAPADTKQRKTQHRQWRAGILCGVFLCLASGLQQLGIAGTSTAKSGFITALYVVLVPVLSFLFLGRRQSWRIWLAIVLCVAGLYFLCFPGGSGGFSTGDLLTLACAFMFALQIMLVSHFVESVGALRLTFLQFLTEAVLATILMLLFENPTLSGLRAAVIPIAYAGIMSNAVGYSLQAVGQRGLNPAIASLAMCMESVFSAIGGWLILHETLSPIETLGCIFMFGAIVLAQLPGRKPDNSG